MNDVYALFLATLSCAESSREIFTIISKIALFVFACVSEKHHADIYKQIEGGQVSLLSFIHYMEKLKAMDNRTQLIITRRLCRNHGLRTHAVSVGLHLYFQTRSQSNIQRDSSVHTTPAIQFWLVVRLGAWIRYQSHMLPAFKCKYMTQYRFAHVSCKDPASETRAN